MTEAAVRATVIAHAIRLGKCPAIGVTVDFNMRMEDIDSEDLAAGLLDKAVPRTENQRVAFVVTAEDIAAGRKLITTR